MSSGFRRESTPIRTLIFNLPRIILFLLKPVKTLMDKWTGEERERESDENLMERNFRSLILI